MKKDLHLDFRGSARMVDVSGKAVTRREASARGILRMTPAAFDALASGRLAKGDALAVARIAGIQAAKKTPDWIPLCHPIALESVAVDVALVPRSRQAVVTATAMASGRTGVEMEALCAAAAACLALYDMVKAIDRSAVIVEIALEGKSGGRSGEYRRGKMSK